jgi:hypothetical protein
MILRDAPAGAASVLVCVIRQLVRRVRVIMPAVLAGMGMLVNAIVRGVLMGVRVSMLVGVRVPVLVRVAVGYAIVRVFVSVGVRVLVSVRMLMFVRMRGIGHGTPS